MGTLSPMGRGIRGEGAVKGSGLWHAEHAWLGHVATDVLIDVEKGRIFAGVEGGQGSFSDGDVDAWVARVDELWGGEGVHIGAAIHSVRAVDPASMRVVAAWARQRKAPLHMHLAEQPAEADECLAVEGCTPAALLEREGILGPDLTTIHAIHVNDADVALLGSHPVRICAGPTTERDLGDRVGPLRALADAGSPLCLGSDSNSVIDVLEEARALELDQRRAT